jgi:release factor glutamine methyltransferase
MTARELLDSGRRRLADLPETDPALEARALLRRTAGFTDLEILAYPDRPVAAVAARRFLRLIEARRGRVPLAYIVGEKEFWSIPMTVSPAVLIPRPETELLVEKTLALAVSSEPTIVEIGTGSGCIAVALAKEFPGARLLATDISRRSLRVAVSNAVRHGTTNIEFVRGDLFGALRGRDLEGRVDFIVSNPPYVAAAEWTRLVPEVRDHEPRQALVPGPTGLEMIRRLIRGGRRFLKSGGILLLEFGDGQADEVLGFLDARWARPEIILDLSGRPRVLAVSA